MQGQRTVGITEKQELAPYDELRELYNFEPPPEKGVNTVEACEGILKGGIRAFVGLGGNFVRAIPEREAMVTHQGDRSINRVVGATSEAGHARERMADRASFLMFGHGFRRRSRLLGRR